MKSLKLALVAAATAAVLAPAQAQGLTYSVGIFTSNSDYAEAEDFKPALKLGADYDFGNGLYAGAAYSTGKFKGQTKARGELTLTVGYGNELANGISYDLSASRYVYPNSVEANYNDATLSVGYGPVSVAYTKAFTSSGFTGGHSIDYTFEHAFNDKLSAGVTFTTEKDQPDTYEIFGAYDLGNNLSLSGSINKDKPKLVVGITKSF